MRHTPALIETMRIRNGLAPLWYLHIRRLATSCKALGIPLPGELPPPEGGLDRTVRWEVGMRGVQESERLVEPVESVKLIISRIAHHPYPHKTTERAQFDRARDKARGAEADDALLLTPGGYLAETAIWSVFWWEGGKLCAPAMELGILPGVGRARIMELAGPIEERRATWSEVRGLPMFLANAVRGVAKVSAVQDDRVPSAKQTDELAAHFWP
ncbi:MAG TPA: aminotransferase class IV [Gemmatimonadales bacterium]|jgi:branched-subunit amino acid aminotransferase/4-amino-4-deoxychorismate lyase|nr:aminotransferase class IV [Gemmatimonadales bacterium]